MSQQQKGLHESQHTRVLGPTPAILSIQLPECSAGLDPLSWTQEESAGENLTNPRSPNIRANNSGSPRPPTVLPHRPQLSPVISPTLIQKGCSHLFIPTFKSTISLKERRDYNFISMKQE